MKKLWSLIVLLSLLSPPAFAVGTVTQTVESSGSGYTLTLTWTADAAAATVPNTAITTFTSGGFFLTMVETNPGATAPTDNYDITILTAAGADLMGGALANRDTSTTEIAFPVTTSPPIDGTITFTLSGNSVNSATGTVKLYFSRTPTAGTGITTTTSASTVDPSLWSATYTSAQTNTVFLSAPSAGTRIVVIGVFVASSVTANVSVIMGFHATVTPASGTARVFGHPAVSATNGAWKQLGGSSIGVGGDAVPLLITTGAIADGAFMVDVLYIVEAVP
jgi:hypothetical protein